MKVIDTQDRVNDLNSDWIKYVVGSDGQTVRESEMALHAELAMKVVKKHLPRRHDQKSHAPKARAGSTGGAMRARSDIPGDYKDMDALHQYTNGVSVVNMRGRAVFAEYVNNKELEQILDGVHDTEIFAAGEDSLWKNRVVTNLSNDTGLSYQRTNELIKTWADTSNDNNPVSLGIQQAASELFDAPLTTWQQSKMEHILNDEDPEYMDRFFSAVEDGKKLLSAMYIRTQTALKGYGLKNVVLYRGVSTVWEEGRGSAKAADYPISENAIESWSAIPGIAVSFAEAAAAGESGVMFQADIPVERILATPKTGFGCLAEFEFVVLGSKEDDYARVVGVY